jgi:hypothetical protein
METNAAETRIRAPGQRVRYQSSNLDHVPLQGGFKQW